MVLAISKYHNGNDYRFPMTYHFRHMSPQDSLMNMCCTCGVLIIHESPSTVVSLHASYTMIYMYNAVQEEKWRPNIFEPGIKKDHVVFRLGFMLHHVVHDLEPLVKVQCWPWALRPHWIRTLVVRLYC